MHRYLKAFAILSFGLLASRSGNAQASKASQPNPITAIDILLEPDATMINKARAANQRLLKEYPREGLI